MRHATDGRAPSAATFEFEWHEGTSSDDVAEENPARRYRRSVDLRWIPEVGERVHMTNGGAIQLPVERIEWQVDGTPLIVLEPWIASDPPPWAQVQGFRPVDA